VSDFREATPTYQAAVAKLAEPRAPELATLRP
jgi:hypothetical protein